VGFVPRSRSNTQTNAQIGSTSLKSPRLSEEFSPIRQPPSHASHARPGLGPRPWEPPLKVPIGRLCRPWVTIGRTPATYGMRVASEPSQPIVILDRQSEVGTVGRTVLKFTLNAAPASDWVQLFHDAVGTKSGSFNFIHSDPEVSGNTIIWSVPVEDVQAAVEYVEEALPRANGKYPDLLGQQQENQLDEAEQARYRKEADEAGMAERSLDEAEQARYRKEADEAGVGERFPDEA